MSKTDYCPYPITATTTCGAEVHQTGRGRPRVYCADPDHTAENRLAAERRHRAEARKAQTEPTPLGDRVEALAEALARTQELNRQLIEQLAALPSLALELGDVQAMADEMDVVRRKAFERVQRAEAARVAAEQDAAAARRERDAALELRDLAESELEEIVTEAAALLDAVPLRPARRPMLRRPRRAARRRRRRRTVV